MECVQADNGFELTNRFFNSQRNIPTLFEATGAGLYIRCKLILPNTPRHNGKVERQHRLDEKRFYSKMRMYSLEDGRNQLKKYNRISNNIPKCCLSYRSPQKVLQDYPAVM